MVYMRPIHTEQVFAQPHFRRPFLLAPQYTWSVSAQAVGDSFHYFVYAMRKGQRKADELPVPFGQLPGVPAENKGFHDSSAAHEHMEHEDYLMCMDL